MRSHDEWRRGRRRVVFSIVVTILAVGLMTVSIVEGLPDAISFSIGIAVVFGSLAAYILWSERGRPRRGSRQSAREARSGPLDDEAERSEDQSSSPATIAGTCEACGADLRPAATHCGRCGATVPKG